MASERSGDKLPRMPKKKPGKKKSASQKKKINRRKKPIQHKRPRHAKALSKVSPAEIHQGVGPEPRESEIALESPDDSA